MVAPYLPTLVLRAHADGVGPFPLRKDLRRHNLALSSRPLEPPCLVPGWGKEAFTGLSPVLIDIVTHARAPSMPWSGTYSLHGVLPKLKSHRDVLGQCFPSSRKGSEKRLSASSLNVAAIAQIILCKDTILGTAWHNHWVPCKCTKVKSSKTAPPVASIYRPYSIGLKLNSWRATALHSLAPTLIKHTWSS